MAGIKTLSIVSNYSPFMNEFAQGGRFNSSSPPYSRLNKPPFVPYVNHHHAFQNSTRASHILRRHSPAFCRSVDTFSPQRGHLASGVPRQIPPRPIYRVAGCLGETPRDGSNPVAKRKPNCHQPDTTGVSLAGRAQLRKPNGKAIVDWYFCLFCVVAYLHSFLRIP